MKKLFENWRQHNSPLNEASYYRFKAKIDEQKIPFLLVSAYREGGNNQAAHKSLKSDLASAGYSFTEVVGGGQEELKDDEGEFVPGEDGKPMVTNVREMTLLVTPEQRGTGQMEGTAEEISALFALGQSMANKYSQFAFIFGYPQTVDDPIAQQTSKRMFIAAYDSQAPAPGDAYRIKEPWAGPWSTIEKAAEDDVYYTKIAGTKGTLVQEAILNKIRHIKLTESKSMFDRMKKNYHLKRWKSLLQ